jgi:O-methyltransferase
MSARFRFIIDPLQASVRRFFRAFGYEIMRMGSDYTKEEREIFSKVHLFTATSIERVAGLMQAIEYLTKNKIGGAIVECGVWRGGSMMAAMLALLRMGDTTRHFYLFDTYEGMPPPTSKDVTTGGANATDLLAAYGKETEHNYWCIASLEDVQRNVFSTGYPHEKIHFIKGRVEETLPMQAPRDVALLRLDTDWYESTKHEIMHLYPNLCQHGVLILDDYGYWQGSRQAVDEYLNGLRFKPLLSKLDGSGRIAIKSA